MKNISLTAAVAATLLICSCSDGDKWRIHGKIEGLSDNETILLEGSNQGRWYTMDTIKVDKDGTFDYSRLPQGYPDIYRLRTGDNSLYFPIDSIETLTITATAPDIAANHTLSGSAHAESLVRVDSLLTASAAALGASGVVNDESLKRTLGNMVISDPSGIISYYIISKKIGGQPLFNPSVSLDHRIIGAVANAYNQTRPSDPRTSYLKRLFIENRRSSSTPRNVIEAKEVGAFDIKLFDRKGVERSLLDLTSKGNTVVLNFTAYNTEWSPAFNIELNKVYERYHEQGLEIYQVSVDTDEYKWKQTAANLPWISVMNNLSADGNSNLVNYNVSSIPTTFIINREGVIAARVDDITKLDSTVAKYM